MRKSLFPLLMIMCVLILPMWFFISWDIGFEAADMSWWYSLYHFLDFKRKIVFVIYVLFVFVLALLIRDLYQGIASTFIDLGIVSLAFFLFLQCAQLLFSLHTLAQGGEFNTVSSAYSPITNSLIFMFVQFGSTVLPILSFALANHYNRFDA